LHEPGEMGLFNVQEICARTKALGLAGKVTISHGFCLGGVTERKVADAAETMAEAGVALVTHGAGGLTMPPIEMLRAAGVLVFAVNVSHRLISLIVFQNGHISGALAS
jgi:cytosine deaminase